jgi:hypothetical protein
LGWVTSDYLTKKEVCKLWAIKGLVSESEGVEKSPELPGNCHVVESTCSRGDVISCACDFAKGEISFAINGNWCAGE